MNPGPATAPLGSWPRDKRIRAVNVHVVSDLLDLMQVLFCTHPMTLKNAEDRFQLLSRLQKPLIHYAATPKFYHVTTMVKFNHVQFYKITCSL